MRHTTLNRELHEKGNLICAAARASAAKLLGRVFPHVPRDSRERFVRSGFVDKYWDLDDPIDHARLARECEEQWLAYDSTLTFTQNTELLVLRKWMKTNWFKTKWYRRNRNVIEFTPGEHEIASQGQVSVEAKLARGWSCTPEAFPAFSAVCYDHKGLRRASWRKIVLHLHHGRGLITPRARKELYRRIYRNATRKLRAKGTYSERSLIYHAGRLTFQALLSQVVQETSGSRFRTVDKNNTKRRPICIEPLGNLILQRQIATPLRMFLSSIGNDLETGQDRHRKLIADPSYATIDFSNASDSISMDLVKWLLPKELVRDLEMARSPWTRTSDGFWYPLNKVSAMGNGFTFELLSLILLGAARSLDPTASVYGDDVIIKNEVAGQFLELCRFMGFQINESKSFIGQPVRESCGAFYDDAIGYITRFDFREIRTITDVIIHGNKALELGLATPGPLGYAFLDYWSEIADLIPDWLKGPPSPLQLEDRYLVDPERSHTKWESAYQKRYSLQCMICYRPRKRTETLRVFPDAGRLPKLLAYLYSGRKVDDYLRGAGALIVTRRRVYEF